MLDIDFATRLTDLFTAHRHRPWYFVASGGNWGDSLIYAGARYLARSLGLRWTDLDYQTIASTPPPRGSCIYLHGGGGLNSWCTGRAFSNLRNALNVADSLLIQGPQTCDIGNNETTNLFASALSKTSSAEIHFFAREMTSARVLAGILPSAFRLHVDHDTAFHAPPEELLALSGLQRVPRGRYELVIAREDNEAPMVPLVPGNDAVTLDPALFARTFSHWLRIHAYANRITTNRLHSAIAGSIFGKRVELLPASYHKNRSVWEFSLKERGVEWRERVDAPPVSSSSFNWLPERVANSWKFQRGLLWMRGVPLH